MPQHFAGPWPASCRQGGRRAPQNNHAVLHEWRNHRYWHKGAFFQEAPDDVRGTTGKVGGGLLCRRLVCARFLSACCAPLHPPAPSPLPSPARTTPQEAIFERDYSAPTGEDKGFDKSMLPKVMQVGGG